MRGIDPRTFRMSQELCPTLQSGRSTTELHPPLGCSVNENIVELKKIELQNCKGVLWFAIICFIHAVCEKLTKIKPAGMYCIFLYFWVGMHCLIWGGHFSKLGAYYFFSFSEIHFQYVGLHNFMPSIYDFLREGGGGGGGVEVY